ncbi:MAG: stringent starvation protein B [Nitrosopumilaceae archaeon]
MSDENGQQQDNIPIALSSIGIHPALKYHLILAMYNWCVEEGHVPFILIDVSIKREQISPMKHLGQFVNNNQIILNIHPTAALDLEINKEFISFGARFGGVQTRVMAPINSVIGIIAKETKVGFLFPPVKEENFPAIVDTDKPPPTLATIRAQTSSPYEPPQTPPPRGKPKLTIVK